MTQEDISRLDHSNHYKKRESPMNAWLNVIYKMMADGCSNELIYFYIKRQKAFRESERNLADYIYLIGKKFSRQNSVQCKNGYGMGVTT